jgi:hypothetical protein
MIGKNLSVHTDPLRESVVAVCLNSAREQRAGLVHRVSNPLHPARDTSGQPELDCQTAYLDDTDNDFGESAEGRVENFEPTVLDVP